ncbi:MAG: hypothetical protein ACFFAO_21310, partial [Candidatus Hermodarchaeota archaeon]
INMALNQELPIQISFEKISKAGQKEESKIAGLFKFEGKDSERLRQLEEEIQEREQKKKKQQQKRKHK